MDWIVYGWVCKYRCFAAYYFELRPFELPIYININSFHAFKISLPCFSLSSFLVIHIIWLHNGLRLTENWVKLQCKWKSLIRIVQCRINGENCCKSNQVYGKVLSNCISISIREWSFILPEGGFSVFRIYVIRKINLSITQTMLSERKNKLRPFHLI